jgi:hypothetical protein
VPPKSFNEKPLLAGNVTRTFTFMFATRGIVTTHWVALDATHVTPSESWAEAVATNVEAQIVMLKSAVTDNREKITSHLMRA